jgi:ABC-type uncharacterized transport system ATPase subunit
MNKGRAILSGRLDELHRQVDSRPHLRLTVDDGASTAPVANDADVDEFARDGEDGEYHVRLRTGASLSHFLSRLVATTPVKSVSTEPPRLHDVFVRAVREDDARQAAT